jgi:catechol 2,3-dioxygenase-like lactoylglutathione lyase family enzyme
MTSGIKTVLYPVKDLARAKALYGKLLGVEPDMDEAYYVGFRVGDQDVGLDPNGHSKGMTGPVGYWHGRQHQRESQGAPRRRRCGAAGDP